MRKLAAIVGPTASGKTDLALELAKRLNGEIISCDSMQVYRGMDIGTAKASEKEQALVPHHLIDIVDIDADFNVADYQRMTVKIINQLNDRGKLPLLVGGTGLYYQAVVDDYQFFPMESQKQVRKKWENFVDEYGLDLAYDKLKEVDEEYSNIISSNDRKRIIRSLEVYELTGKPFSVFQKRNQKKYKLAVIGLSMDRQELYHRIDKRVDRMIEQGFIDEILLLRQKGQYRDDLNSMQALGYKQVIAYLDGLIDRESMINEIKRETRRFAKRQLTWFNKDKRIFWIEAGEKNKTEIILEKMAAYIERQFHTV